MKWSRRWAYAAWLVLIGVLALIHAVNLRADFPNHSPWIFDWAKYTDEGWYGNAAVRSHLFGNWYLPGDFNPAVAIPVWPFLEWVLFFFTGVTIEAARGLVVAVFFANLLLSYLLLRARGPRWMALLAVTLLVTSPFLYSFSRLAILEPLLTALTLAALNLAIRLPRLRRPTVVSIGIGLIFALVMLTKTTGLFLLPALAWAMLAPLKRNRSLALRCAGAAAVASIAAFGAWMGLVAHFGLFADYKYLFRVNSYPKPAQLDWPLVSLWWSVHGCMWVDRILAPLAGLILAGALLSATVLSRRNAWGRDFLLDPVAGASILAIAGYIFFMTYQDHPQPRYYSIVAFFCFFEVAQGIEALLRQTDWWRALGKVAVAGIVAAAGINGFWTLFYATHPQYTFVTAADDLVRYIDKHSDGDRLLLSISGDEISLITHVRAICDDFGTQDLPEKIAVYKPGWFATWNDFDPGTLEDIHTRYSIEQVAVFRAFDDPERNQLVLFKLHPLPHGQIRDREDPGMHDVMPGDRINIPIQ